VTNPAHKISITDQDINQRLDHFLTAKFRQFTRSYIQQLIANGHVLVNDTKVKSGFRLRAADSVYITIPEPEASPIRAENIPLDIIYEDSDLLVIDKPAGMVVHPGAGNRSGTMVNALLFHCRSLSGINGILRPGIVHRLDKNTSGLLVVAKNDRSHLSLTGQFETRDIVRIYAAVVWGIPQASSGLIETNIDRSHRDRKKMSVSGMRGKPAITKYHVEEELNGFSLLRLTLGTGRTHQIRVHLNYINHPVFGDREYNGGVSQLNRIAGNRRKIITCILKDMPRQALHARELSFIHPASNKRLSFYAPIPEDIDKTIHALKTA
jgi:23S rRNA pseudouridine1911/1915/1917 synthase